MHGYVFVTSNTPNDFKRKPFQTIYPKTWSEGIDTLQESNDHGNGGNNQLLLRKALDDTILSLGGPIHKTITWHMNNKGLLSDPRKIDLSAFYLNLRELIGPGADMIIEETWQKLKNNYKGRFDLKSGTPLDKMMRLISGDEEAA